jgi:hypothetical protein
VWQALSAVNVGSKSEYRSRTNVSTVRQKARAMPPVAAMAAFPAD